MPNGLYEEISPPPDSYTAGNALGRLIDAFGFRYRWATEGLTDQDLDYEPGGSGKSLRQTLNHLHWVTVIIESTLDGRQFPVPEPTETMPFAELRRETLERVKRISSELKTLPPERFDELRVRFRAREKDHEHPFWNAINGPIADVLYHVGQVVSYRRSAGNPIDPAVQPFYGKKVVLK